MRGLVGSILVAFFNCLDVFFCFIAFILPVLPAVRSAGLPASSPKRKDCLFRRRQPGKYYFCGYLDYADLRNGLVDSIFFDFFKCLVVFFDSTATSPSVVALWLSLSRRAAPILEAAPNPIAPSFTGT